MKKKITFSKSILVTLGFMLCIIKMQAQCMLVPISLDQHLQQSSLVVEAVVVSKRCVWDNNHQAIYTIYTLQPTANFKGNTNGNIEIVAKGGEIGSLQLNVTNEIKTPIGSAGVFNLIPTNNPVTSQQPLYECYAAEQGFIKYDGADHSASNIFNKYPSIENNLYTLIETKLGKQRTIINELNWNTIKGTSQINTPGSILATISSFSPTSITAGTQSVLTITGTGFGSTQGTSYVAFKNADDGGSTYIQPLSGEYISWTDTQIQVEVPDNAGTGTIRVVTSSTVTSSSSLTVNYARTNGASGTEPYFPQMVGSNSVNGLTWTMNSSVSANAVTYFTKAMEDWICNSGVSWQVSSSTTSTAATAFDGSNVVYTSGSLSVGILAQTAIWIGNCGGNTGANPETDMVISTFYSWYYGTGTPSASQYDFYSVMLHELGHAHILGHVINTSAIMHYSIAAGTSQRNFTAAVETAGAANVMAVSTTSASGCGYDLMNTLSCTVPTVTLSASSTSVSENGGTSVITATLSNVYKSAVTVNLALTGTATTATDYTLATSITIPVGTTSASITLTAVNDAGYEGDETVIANISSVTNGTESGTQVQTITIVDDETAPTVTLATSFSISTEGGSGLTITATRSNAALVATTVNFAFSGTAIYGTDYTMNSSITIPSGSTSATTSLVPTDDANDELTETIIIDISSVTNGTESGTQQLNINLNDNDGVPSVTLSSSTTTIAEAAGTSTITATMSGTSYQDVTVTLTRSGTATNTTDYTLGTTSIVITAGNLTGSTTVTAVQDALDEPDETVILNITAVTNGTESGTQTQTITITDDDAAPTVTLSTGTTSIAEAAGSTTVTATLSAASGQSVSITLVKSGTATDVTDYTLSATTITIAAGNTTGSTTLTAVQDVVYEGNEIVILDINTVTNGTENGTQQKTVTITDDETIPTVTLTTGASSIAEAAGSTTVTATLSTASTQAITVNLSLSGTATVTSDYTLATSISIPAGSTSASITLTAVQDVLDEANETVVVDISSITNATENGSQQQTITITDDDAAPTVTLSVNNTTIAEAGGVATVTATLSAVSGQNIIINLTTSGTATGSSTDYTISSNSITLNAGSTSGTVTITAAQDVLDEDNETVITDISAVTNGTENGTQSVTTSITDDDATPTVSITWSNSSIGEAATSTSNAVVTLSAVSGRAVTVNLGWICTATFNTDYSVTSSAVTIPAGSSSEFATITVIPDNLYEGNECAGVEITTVSNATENGTQQAFLTINDDDAAPTITLSTSAANITESGGVATITVTQSAISGLATTVTITKSGTATSGTDYTLGSTSLSIPAGSTTATTTLTAITDAVTEGTETVILDITTVTNGTESGTQQQTINIIEGVVPVRFSSFSATSNQCTIVINFATAFEQNNNHFEIQWSLDGVSWVSIATIASKGNSSLIQAYNYNHSNPSTGNNYYRIKQVDNDGKAEYTNIVIAKSNCSGNVKAVVYPNPFVSKLNITGLQNDSKILLINNEGKTVYSLYNKSTSTLVISTEAIAAGNYQLLVINKDGMQQTISIIK